MALPSPTVAPAIIKGSIRRGTNKLIWCPSIAAIATPTVAEITAGTDYTNQISAIDGFDTSPNSVDFGNAGSRLTPKLAGPTSLNDGTVTFNLSNDPAVSDARTVFLDGIDGSAATTGYWIDAPNGLVTSAKIQVMSCEVQSAQPSSDLDAPLTLAVSFTVNAKSAFITVPSA